MEIGMSECYIVALVVGMVARGGEVAGGIVPILGPVLGALVGTGAGSWAGICARLLVSRRG
ncbi:hypothetical protein D3C81_1394270 [compost metagenome]